MTAAFTQEHLPPNVDIMPPKELLVVASALDAIGKEWPPALSIVLHDPKSFLTDPHLQSLAVTLCTLHNRPVHPDYSPVDFSREFPALLTLSARLGSESTAIGIAELDAATLIQAITGRETARQLQEIVTKLLDTPEKAHLLTAHAAKFLQQASDKANPRPGLSHRTPDDILAFPDDPADTILGDRLLSRGGKLVIAGAGGTGKSRLGTQLAACVITGQPFLAFPTNGHNLKWLILQGENDNTRLKHDLNGLKRQLTPEQWEHFQARCVLHTLETEIDTWLSLEDDNAQSAIRRLLATTLPDVVVLDALYTFGAGDLNKDVDMRATLSLLQQIIHRGNPKRAIVVIHHAQTGKAGLAKAVGHDRASFGRNSKVLHSWARGQINVAPLDPANNDLLGFSCGKASNGREFQPFAARLTENMVYELDGSVDVTETVAAASGTSTETAVTPDEVAALCPGDGITRAKLVKRIRDETGASQATAYRAVDKAIKSEKIKAHTVTKLLYDRTIHE